MRRPVRLEPGEDRQPHRVGQRPHAARVELDVAVGIGHQCSLPEDCERTVSRETLSQSSMPVSPENHVHPAPPTGTIPPWNFPTGWWPAPSSPTDAQAVCDLIAAAETVDAGPPAIDLEDIEGDWVRRQLRPRHREHRGVGRRPTGGCRRGLQGASGRRVGPPRLPGSRHRHLARRLARGVREGQGVDARRTDRPRRQRPGGVLQGARLPVGLDVVGAAAARGPAIEPQPLPEGYTLREFAGAGRRPGRLPAHRGRLQRVARPRPVELSTTGRRAARCGRGSSRGRSGSSSTPQGTEVGVCYTILAAGHWLRRRDRGPSRPARPGPGPGPLVDAFERARDHGATVSELSTDSRTGALGLYEHVGMQVTQTWRQWMTDL